MNAFDKNFRTAPNESKIFSLEKEKGFHNSVTIARPPAYVFTFFQDYKNVEKVLANLPKGIKNYLDLNLVSADKTSEEEFKVKWDNNTSKNPAGSVTFTLHSAPANHGTILIASADFEKIDFKHENSSQLMKLFIRRMKSLIETGEIATTTGQPSGREELRTLH